MKSGLFVIVFPRLLTIALRPTRNYGVFVVSFVYKISKRIAVVLFRCFHDKETV